MDRKKQIVCNSFVIKDGEENIQFKTLLDRDKIMFGNKVSKQVSSFLSDYLSTHPERSTVFDLAKTEAQEYAVKLDELLLR